MLHSVSTCIFNVKWKAAPVRIKTYYAKINMLAIKFTLYKSVRFLAIVPMSLALFAPQLSYRNP